jgi:hypothetical protein
VCVSPPMGELIVDVSSELAHKLLPEDAAPPRTSARLAIRLCRGRSTQIWPRAEEDGVLNPTHKPRDPSVGGQRSLSGKPSRSPAACAPIHQK